MSRQYVDRGAPLDGIQTAIRDARVPYNMPRALRNVTLRDKRVSRRTGLSNFANSPLRGIQLSKHTKTSLENFYEDSSQAALQNTLFKTPLSYGLLRWNSDFTPSRDKEWGVEFILTLGEKEELVVNPYTRWTKSTYGGVRKEIRGSDGVCVYDQSLLANYVDVKFNADNVYAVRPVDPSHRDVFALTALAFFYSSDSITAVFTLYDSAAQAYNFSTKLTYPIDSYVVGESYHVGLTIRSNVVELWVNGKIYDTHTLSENEYFVGEGGAVNGIENTPGDTNLKPDIVLLNEACARAHYQSTCKAYADSVLGLDNGYQSFQSDLSMDSRPEPWVASPPVGTGIHELRYWDLGLLDDPESTITNNLFQRLTALPEGLLGYFPVSGTTPYVKDETNEYRGITLHHTTAAVVSDAGLISGKGLVLADGQHLIRSFGLNSNLYIDPVSGPLREVFGFDADSPVFNPRHDFTVDMQIRTPNTFGQELTKKDGVSTYTGVASDTRDGFNEAKQYGLIHGRQQSPTSEYFVLDENGTEINVTAGTGMRHHRAFDQTLWSVEGEKGFDTGDAANDHYRTRVVLTRGLLTPDGRVAFEFFGWDATAQRSREFRVVTDTVLETDTVVTITFRKKTLVGMDTDLGLKRSYGMSLEIFLDGNTTPDKVLTIGDGVVEPTDIESNGLSSAAHWNNGVRDVIIGSSYVNDFYDASIRKPLGDNTTPTRFPVTQRFMSAYQDQPGFFRLGYFRLWDRAVSDQDVEQYSGRRVNVQDFTSLIMNLEVPDISTDQITDTSKFPGFWDSGFKGWGIIQPRDIVETKSISGVQGGSLLQDCLGFSSYGIPSDKNYEFIKNNSDDFPCTGLAFYSPTLTKTYGVLASFGSHIRYDDRASGDFKDIYSPGYGVLANFYDKASWNAVNIADVTVLTSTGGRPRVYNGKHILPLGYGNWSGGRPLINSRFRAEGGSFQAEMWYGIRIGYYSPTTNTYDLSPQIPVWIQEGHNVIDIQDIYASGDPRVGNIIVASTIAQSSRSLAESAPVYPTQYGYRPNKPLDVTTIIIGDSSQSTFVLDTDFTKAPQCSTAASYNNRLYVAGDPNIPDIIYYSPPGNPHIWYNDTNRIVLEDGTGDRIVALRALFGSLYAFKPNGIWKIDEVGVGTHNVQKIASIGPSTEQSIEVITIPDSGRIAIIFWTMFGPYMFDEVNLQYLGYSVEKETVPFNYVDHNTVFTVHDIFNRQILFFYEDPTQDTTTYVGALVFNYRFNAWSSYQGMPGQVGLSVDLSKGIQTQDDSKLTYEIDSLGLIGDSNGRIFKLDNDVLTDGHSLEEYRYAIQEYNSASSFLNLANLDEFAEDDTLNGLWCSIVSRDFKQWSTVLISRNVGTLLYLDEENRIDWFEPQVGDQVFIGFSPIFIEFPWDNMDLPYYSKQVQRLAVWVNSSFSFRIFDQWEERDIQWKDVISQGKRRILVESPTKSAEAFKLVMQSVEEDFKLDAYAYLVEPTRDATI